MLEDVLSWSIVLIGAIVMHFTDFVLIDPLMSIGVSIFILVNAIKNLKEILDLFLEKVPDNIDLADIEGRLNNIDGVKNVHHIHIWSMDGNNNFATMHVVTDNDPDVIKAAVREELKIHSIVHTTIEIETSQNECCEKNCHIENVSASSKHHHHQHKHHLH